MYLNKVMLYGNLTRDPELRALPSGQKVASFSVATNRSFTDKEGKQREEVEFHNVVAFGRTAEVIGQYLKKGRPIFVEGRIQTRSWEKDGAKQYRTEIVLDQFQFGPSAPGNSRTEREDRGEDTDERRIPEGEDDDEVNPDEIHF